MHIRNTSELTGKCWGSVLLTLWNNTVSLIGGVDTENGRKEEDRIKKAIQYYCYYGYCTLNL